MTYWYSLPACSLHSQSDFQDWETSRESKVLLTFVIYSEQSHIGKRISPGSTRWTIGLRCRWRVRASIRSACWASCCDSLSGTITSSHCSQGSPLPLPVHFFITRKQLSAQWTIALTRYSYSIRKYAELKASEILYRTCWKHPIHHRSTILPYCIVEIIWQYLRCFPQNAEILSELQPWNGRKTLSGLQGDTSLWDSQYRTGWKVKSIESERFQPSLKTFMERMGRIAQTVLLNLQVLDPVGRSVDSACNWGLHIVVQMQGHCNVVLPTERPMVEQEIVRDVSKRCN